jgi:hypothetical protein
MGNRVNSYSIGVVVVRPLNNLVAAAYGNNNLRAIMTNK